MKTEKNIYLVITQSKVPVKGSNTHVKDWAKTGSWQVFEIPIVTDNLKKRYWTEANIIINVTESKIEKNNTPASNDDLYAKVVERYSKHIAQFIARYYPEIIEEFSKVLEAKNLPEKVSEVVNSELTSA